MGLNVKQFNSTEEIEMFFLRVIDLSLPKDLIVEEVLRERIDEVFSYNNFDMCKAQKIIDEKIICSSTEHFYVFENVFGLKIGETVYIDGHNNLVSSADVFKVHFLNRCLKKLKEIEKIDESNYDVEIELDDLPKTQLITPDFILEQIEKIREDKIKEVEKRKKYEEEQRKRREATDSYKTEQLLRAQFKEKSMGTFEEISVNKKVIKDEHEEEIHLPENVNQFYRYEDFDNSGISRRRCYSLKAIMSDLINNKNVDFKYFKEGKLICDIHFEPYNNLINSIRVAKEKIPFIYNQMMKREDVMSEKEIQILNKLLITQIRVLQIKQVSINREGKRLPLDISFEYDVGKTFQVEFLGSKKKVEWDDLKDIMFEYSMFEPTKKLSQFQFNRLIKLVKVPKEKMFEQLRKIVVLQELDDSNES